MATIEFKEKWATPEDWAAHKQTIIRLYQDKELGEVMEIMQRDYDFHSTSVPPPSTAIRSPGKAYSPLGTGERSTRQGSRNGTSASA